ncbi:MAG: transposase [Oscillospiraceae bacterium]|nr:transposase [Oscillospiraceae bacterium]MCL2159902.1 transposase [Oscillospiraceae bacterium]
MKKELPVRKNIRLQGYDYSSTGYYFITICVKNRKELLGNVDVGARIARPLDTMVELSETGATVESAILQIGEKYENVILDKYVIMPNHIHMILALKQKDSGGRAMRAPTISTIINQFKGYATKQIGFSIWQKLYYDEIIQSEQAYRNIWQYIDDNPAKWARDKYYSTQIDL